MKKILLWKHLLASICCLSTAFALNAQTLFGEAAFISPGNPPSCTAVRTTSDASPGWGGIDFPVPPGLTLAGLNTLGTDYRLVTGGAGVGSPRFVAEIQAPCGIAYVLFYIPGLAAPADNLWHNTGNLASPASLVDVQDAGDGGTSCPFAYQQPYSTVQALYAGSPVTGIWIVTDAGWAVGGVQVADFDNTQLNTATYNYEGTDTDGDGIGDSCDPDIDGDGVANGDDCAPNDPTRWHTGNFYRDYDGDGYDDGLYTRCYGELGTQGPEYYPTTLGPDCNDNDATVHEPQPYYVDSDGDGYGAGSVVMLCSSTAPAGYSTNNTDCAPNDPDRWRTGNFYRDYDGDGYDDGLYTRCYGMLGTQGPEYYPTTLGPDCNDNNAAVNPGATEVCDGVDNDCDGQTDEGFPDFDNDNLADCVDLDDDNDGTPDAYDCEPKNKKNNKYLICHNGHTQCISPNAWPAHQAHGDVLGPCPTNRGEITDITEIFEDFKLSIAPNPVISTATIKYELPLDAKVSIVLFDPQGKAISTLVDAERKAGQYNYTLDASRLPAGIYYYRMTAISGDQRFVQGQKLVIVR